MAIDLLIGGACGIVGMATALSLFPTLDGWRRQVAGMVGGISLSASVSLLEFVCIHTLRGA